MLHLKKYFLLSLLLLSFSGFAQNTINNYKYVLVPEQFTFLKQKDQYNLNTLAKNLLADQGFTVYFDNSDIPTDIANNKCSALVLEVIGKSSMFSTNLTILLKDCKGNILFKGKEGKSREKEYDTAYNLALRDAFNSLTDAHYAYNAAGAATVVPDQKPVIAASAPAPVIRAAEKSIPAEATQAAGTLYAQPIANGYHLIDTAPKIVFTLLRTSMQDYFIADNGLANGVVFKRNDSWFFESYKDGQLISEKLLIKF